MATKEVIIGIPVHNDLESLLEMISSLVVSTQAYKKIVIVESGSDEKTLKFLNGINNDKLQVIHTAKDGPIKAYNKLFSIAKEEGCDLFLTQTDVLFPRLYKRDWLQLMNQMAENNNIGAITCRNGMGTSGPDYVNGFQWLGGWCTYFTNRAIEAIGGYDDTFPNGFGVDIDHTYRLVQAKLRVIIMDYWVDHHQMNAREHDTNPNTEQMKQDSAIYFRKKFKLGEFKE